MADRMAAEILIGGEILSSQVEDLCGHIRDEGLSLQYGGAPFVPLIATDLLRAVDDGDGPDGVLRLCATEVAGGAFQDLEDWLREHDIPYTRKSDGIYEYDPEVAEFRPEQGLYRWPANKALEPVVPASPVREAANMLTEAWRLLREAPFMQVQQIIDQLTQATAKLTEVLPPDWPPLPPLSIVADATREVEYYRLWVDGRWDTAQVGVPIRVCRQGAGRMSVWINNWAAEQEWDDPLVAAGLYHDPEDDEEDAAPEEVAPEEVVGEEDAETPVPRLMAVFRPQAWRNDQTIDIDSPVRFDATAKILQFRIDEIRDFQSNNYESDELAEDLPARQAHAGGPFEVDVDLDAWLEAHGVDDRASMTAERWAEIRRLYAPRPAARGGQ